jgi:presenilin-like A22 family membrane protease
MKDRTRLYAAVAFAMVMFLGVQLGALALVQPLEAADKAFTQNPEDPTNSIVYVIAILVATGFMLAAFKYDLDWIVRGFVIVASAGLAWQVFDVLVPQPISLALAALVGVALLAYPEWYVIDTAGVLMGGAAAGLFGISFGLLPSILLLVVLAVYDAISVYGTEHMLDLADGVMDMKVPVILVVPTTLSFSFLDLEPPDVDGDESSTGTADGASADESHSGNDVDEPAGESPTAVADGAMDVDASDTPEASGDQAASDDSDPAEADLMERDAFFVGLGDAVMPTILVASAAHFHTAVPSGSIAALGLPYVTMNLPALGAIVGTQIGLVVLLWMVLKGRAHAGLPLLNGGAILGYLVCALAVGLSLPAALGL